MEFTTETIAEKLKAIHSKIISYCFNQDCSKATEEDIRNGNACEYDTCLTLQFNTLFDMLTPEQQEDILIELHCSNTNC